MIGHVQNKGKVGRPRLDLDERQIIELAKIQCSNEEIAAVMGCSADTIERNYAGAIREGRESGKVCLRQAQWRKAVNDGNPQLLVWLGKFYLGQREELSFASSEGEVRALLEHLEVTAKKKQCLPGLVRTSK